jgi:hypothetical protein
MIISDLEHLEVVSEERSVSGAATSIFSIAQASATSAAFGLKNATALTATSTLAFFDPNTGAYTASSTSDSAAAADVPD